MQSKENSRRQNFYLMFLRYHERNRALRIRIVPPGSEQLALLTPRRRPLAWRRENNDS